MAIVEGTAEIAERIREGFAIPEDVELRQVSLRRRYSRDVAGVEVLIETWVEGGAPVEAAEYWGEDGDRQAVAIAFALSVALGIPTGDLSLPEPWAEFE